MITRLRNRSKSPLRGLATSCLGSALCFFCQSLSVAGCALSVSESHRDAATATDRCSLKIPPRELDAAIDPRLAALVDGSGICDELGQRACRSRFSGSITSCIVEGGVARCVSANSCGIRGGRNVVCFCGFSTCETEDLCVLADGSVGPVRERCVRPCE